MAGKSSLTASTERMQGLEALAASRDRGEADRARAVLLTEVLRDGARALLTQAVEAEVAALLGCHADKLTDDGRQRLVRHGHLPERTAVNSVHTVLHCLM
jgi:hypothetical protein